MGVVVERLFHDGAGRVGDALALLESHGRREVLGLASRRDSLVQLVDLLERESLGLVDEEVDEGDADEAASEPDEEDLALQVGIAWTVVDEIRGRVRDSPVEEPLWRAKKLVIVNQDGAGHSMK